MINFYFLRKPKAYFRVHTYILKVSWLILRTFFVGLLLGSSIESTHVEYILD